MFKFQATFDSAKMTAKFKDKFERAVSRNIQMNEEIGQLARDQAVLRAKLGRPLNDSGRFPPIKQSTKDRREFLAQFNPTDPQYVRGRSQLTFTGQLLNSMEYFVNATGLTRGGVLLRFSGSRRPYQGANGPYSVSPQADTNPKLAKILAEKGFRVFTATGIKRELLPRFTRIVRRRIRLALAQMFKK